MDMKAEIKKMEEAISSIQDFLMIHVNDVDKTTMEAWSDVRKGIIEELYYMKKSSEND